MNKKIDFDLVENACELCSEVFFTYFTNGIDGTDPNFCPYCGTQFSTKNGVLMKQKKYNGKIFKYKSGFKAVIDCGSYSHTSKWHKTEDEAKKMCGEFAFRHWNGSVISWMPTINKIKGGNDGK